MASVVVHWTKTLCAQDPSKAICHASANHPTFTDVLSHFWAANAIDQASRWRIMTGNSETTFNPDGSLTRTQALKVLNQLLNDQLKKESQRLHLVMSLLHIGRLEKLKRLQQKE